LIVLKKNQFQAILDQAFTSLPNEACGLLGGKSAGENKYVEKVYLLTNTDHSPEHFAMDPREQFAAVKDMRAHGWEMLGNFHSHPESPARPSAEDKRLAYDHTLSYLILSLQDKENPVLKGFKIREDSVAEEKILLEEEEKWRK
jgi:proteasome lid subunit RPN8/RPN11